MTDKLPNRIAEVRKRLGMTQQQLADATGSHWVTISKLERGITKLTVEWALKIGAVLDIDYRALLSDEMFYTHKEIGGLISSDGTAKRFPKGKMVEIFSEAQEKTYHLQMSDNDLYPFIQKGDIFSIYMSNADDADGRLCVVSIKATKPTYAIGIVRKTEREGFVDITPLRGGPLRSVEVAALSVIESLTFSPDEAVDADVDLGVSAQD